jgi:hypothetical protein
MTLPEWGLGWGDSDDGAPVSDPGTETSGGDDPTFINDMAGWISTNHVFEATLWDVTGSAISSTQNPNSFAAAVADFGSSAAIADVGQSPISTTENPISLAAPVADVGSSTAIASAPNKTALKPDVSVHFTGSSTSITQSSRDSLVALTKGLSEGATLTVVGRSYRDAKLARVRAYSIVRLISSRGRVHMVVRVSTSTRNNASTVTS